MKTKKKTAKQAPKREPLLKWDDTHYVTIYQILKSGGTEADICRHFEISRRCWVNWKQQKPSISKILNLPECRTHPNSTNGAKEQETLHEYVYRRLDPQLQKLWDDIHRFKKEKNGLRKIELMLANQGKRVRQYLFLHAMAVSNFNPTRACRRVCLNRSVLNDWIQVDPDFQRLFQQMEIVREELYEESLVVKCRGHWTKDEKGRTVWMPGDTKAIIFANSTKNRHRGYGRNVEITHKEVDQDAVTIQELLEEIPVEIQEKIVEKMRAKKQITHEQEQPIEAEFEVKE